VSGAGEPLPRRAFLGAELPADHVAFTPGGVRVDGVVEGGMAERAGVRGGDTIVEVAGLPVRTLAELGAALRVAGAAGAARVRYARGEEVHEREVEVARAPLEEIEAGEEGAELAYGVLAVGGARLRTIATCVRRPRAVVLVLQGIACESIEGGDAPMAQLAHGWARAGIEALRFDKRGAGDSEGGPCGELDFHTERADAAAALELARGRARECGVPLVLFGHSVGGIIAASLAGEHEHADGAIAGVITFGAPTSRWLECLIDTTRRQYELRGTPPDEIERATAELSRRAFATGLNGRSAAYHAQLDAIDPAVLWSRVRAPVLVVRGEHDWVVRDDDQARIVSLVAGSAELAHLPGLDHVLGWHPDREASLRDYGAGRFDASIVRATIEWIERL
jgi:pimeloyl-ACP methyl ester carboxylesterase